MFTARGSQARLYGALVSFLLSFTGLLYIHQDDLPAVNLFRGFRWYSKNSTAAFPPGQQTALQHDPPPQDPPYGSVVVAARGDTDLTWTAFVQSDYSIYAYNVDDPANNDTRLRIPANKGREAMVYLSWIIDNYDDLPWSAFFVHGHESAWHQPDEISRLVLGMNRISLARAGYISLRCDWFPSCPAELRPIHNDAIVWGSNVNHFATERAIAGNWKQLFPHEKLPETLASPCCAQFAVSRQAILRRPIEDYQRLRNWLLDSLLPDDFSGRVLEKVWAYLFTGNAVHCPPPRQCMCEYFTDQCDAFKPEEAPEGVDIPDWGRD